MQMTRCTRVVFFITVIAGSLSCICMMWFVVLSPGDARPGNYYNQTVRLDTPIWLKEHLKTAGDENISTVAYPSEEISPKGKPTMAFTPEHAHRYFIYYCGLESCGGLSDREKGMVIAYIIAYITNRKFGVHVRIPSSRCSFPSFYDTDNITWNINSEELTGLSKRKMNVGFDGKFIDQIKGIDFDKVFREDVVYFSARLHYWGSLLKNMKYRRKLGNMVNLTEDQVFAQLIPRILPLNDELQGELETFVSLGRPEKESKLVCAHIRKGRNPIDHKNAQRIFLFLKRFMSTHSSRIFLASDTQAFKDQAQKMFGKQYIYLSGQAVHIENERDSRRLCAGYKFAILEQRILSKCDVLLLTFSGFGRVAAYIRNSDKDLYCYKDGVIIPCRTADLLKIYKIPN